ncbi:PorT family protein [Labilibacter sediminis]|nr:PorT family protein [Labilibacter sediminis]
MKKDNNHIDKVFREGLEHNAVAPPSFVWDSIEKQLSSQKQQRRSLFIWRSISAAAVVGLIFVAGLFWFTQPNNNSIVQNQPNLIQSYSITKEKVMDNNITSEISTNNIKSKQTVITLNTKTSTIHKTKSKNALKNIHPKAPQENKNNIVWAKIESKSTIQLNNYNETDATGLFRQHNSSNNTLYAASQNIFVNPFDDTETPQKKKNIELAVGGQFSPSYSYGNASSSENNAPSAVKESGIMSYTGGLNLNLKTKKRWSIETGVYYAQVGQKFSNPMEPVSSMQYYNAKHSEKNTAPTATVSTLNNSLGKIKLNNNQNVVADYTLEQSNTAFKIGVDETKASYNEIETITVQQELNYIEVPFLLKYDILNKSINLSVSGGVSTNFLVGNNAYLLNNNSKEKIGETENINDFNYSAVVGLGLRTPIWKSIEFNLEPKLRYFMNSVTSESSSSYRPYSIGIYTGISYRFK